MSFILKSLQSFARTKVLLYVGFLDTPQYLTNGFTPRISKTLTSYRNYNITAVLFQCKCLFFYKKSVLSALLCLLFGYIIGVSGGNFMNFDNIFAKDENGNVYRGYAAVSYTHLTLPTIA